MRNLALGTINGLIVAVGFAGLWVAAAEWASRNGIGLLNQVALPTWAHIVGAVLLLDVWMYAWHRLNHRVPFLWRLHRVHHSDAQMDVTTASRFHTGEIVLSSILRIGVIVSLGANAWELVFYETVMFAVVQFHHSNLSVPPALDRVLRAVIATPAMHKVHHSRWQPETDSNYGSLFSWWDRLFWSFRLRTDLEAVRLGLDGFDTPEHESLRGLGHDASCATSRRLCKTRETDRWKGNSRGARGVLKSEQTAPSGRILGRMTRRQIPASRADH